jgi:hypothetical protein
MTDTAGVDRDASPEAGVLSDVLPAAATALVVGAMLDFVAAIALASDQRAFSGVSEWRSRLVAAAQGANSFTAGLLVLSVVLVALFDYSFNAEDTRLPRQWRTGVLFGVISLGAAIALLDLVDLVNFQTLSLGANRATVHLRDALSDIAALTLASTAIGLAWRVNVSSRAIASRSPRSSIH